MKRRELFMGNHCFQTFETISIWQLVYDHGNLLKVYYVKKEPCFKTLSTAQYLQVKELSFRLQLSRLLLSSPRMVTAEGSDPS